MTHRRRLWTALGLTFGSALLAVFTFKPVSWRSEASISLRAHNLMKRFDVIAGGKTVRMMQTAQGRGNWAWQPDLVLGGDFDFAGPVVEVDLYTTDQDIIGFGGAFTEAAAVTWQKLNGALQEQVLDRYFSLDGLGYTVGRVHINSCDFSTSSYSFDDVPDDFGLEHFDMGVQRDQQALLPLIKQAMGKVTQAGAYLMLLAAPWSPPAWMKTNSMMDTSKWPGLKPEYRDVWARYISKWIQAYKDSGVPVWAISVQNEPEANSGWESCIYSMKQEADFLGNFLGPTLLNEHPEVAIFVFDHNKDRVNAWADAIHSHPTAWRFMHGVAFHWYAGDFFNHVAEVHQKYPQVSVLATEATYEKYRWKPGSSQAAAGWDFGEGYAHDIIGDLNAGAAGWLDWNLLLDTFGGPNHVGNVCDAAMVADEAKQEVVEHPQYFFIGHFSKFIRPGSKRLLSTVFGSRTYGGPTRPYGTCTENDGLQATAFRRPDLQVAIVTLNCGSQPLEFKIRTNQGAVRVVIPPHAIQSFLFPVDMPAEFIRKA